METMEILITRTAHELTIKFQDESDIPTRFNKASKNSKIDKISKIEQTYQAHVKSWSEAINSILENVKDNEQAWRFIRVSPKVDDKTINTVTLCDDFIAFANLLIQRRDIDKCTTDELGKLCLLSVAFQKEIEKQLTK